jgi:hypothetical protein
MKRILYALLWRPLFQRTSVSQSRGQVNGGSSQIQKEKA